MAEITDKSKHDGIYSENEMLRGQLSGSLSGLQERSGATTPLNKHHEKQQSDKQRSADLIDLVNRIIADNEKLASDIAKMEQDFHQRYGDAWRENLALQILDPDEIPPRHDDENMTDYRERLEQHLINEMLNDDGSIKDEYKDHPEYGDYAQWAQKQFNYNSAQTAVAELKNSETTPERQAQILEGLEQRANTEEQTYAEREAAPQSDIQSEIKDGADNSEDNSLKSNQDIALNEFLAPKI